MPAFSVRTSHSFVMLTMFGDVLVNLVVYNKRKVPLNFDRLGFPNGRAAIHELTNVEQDDFWLKPF